MENKDWCGSLNLAPIRPYIIRLTSQMTQRLEEIDSDLNNHVFLAIRSDSEVMVNPAERLYKAHLSSLTRGGGRSPYSREATALDTQRWWPGPTQIPSTHHQANIRIPQASRQLARASEPWCFPSEVRNYKTRLHRWSWVNGERTQFF
jgi:hypothetical protein